MDFSAKLVVEVSVVCSLAKFKYRLLDVFLCKFATRKAKDSGSFINFLNYTLICQMSVLYGQPSTS